MSVAAIGYVGQPFAAYHLPAGLAWGDKRSFLLSTMGPVRAGLKVEAGSSDA
jgi:hypothetical protein